MSNFDHIFLQTDLSPHDVAVKLSDLLHMELVTDDRGKVYLSRPASHGHPGNVGGEIGPNIYRYDSGDPEDRAAYDSYPVVWTIGYTRRQDDIQLVETERLFSEMADRVSWPLLLAHGADYLMAAWRPGLGLHRFAPDTGMGYEHEGIWAPYVGVQ